MNTYSSSNEEKPIEISNFNIHRRYLSIVRRWVKTYDYIIKNCSQVSHCQWQLLNRHNKSIKKPMMNRFWSMAERTREKKKEFLHSIRVTRFDLMIINSHRIDSFLSEPVLETNSMTPCSDNWLELAEVSRQLLWLNCSSSDLMAKESSTDRLVVDLFFPFLDQEKKKKTQWIVIR